MSKVIAFVPDTAKTTGKVHLRWLLAVFLVAGFLSLYALWAPVFLASWCAQLARPLQQKVARGLRGQVRAASVITTVLALVISIPLLLLVLALVAAATDLVERLVNSQSWGDALDGLLPSSSGVSFGRLDPSHMIGLLQQHAASAADAAHLVLAVATDFGIFLLVFGTSFYSFLVHGAAIRRWALDYIPVRAEHAIRISEAFFETGRGLLISFGLTALLQAPILAIGYVVIGVPYPMVLGLLTLVASFVPLVGTGLVWVPVTVVLLFVGRTETALWSLGLGCAVSLLDNVMRPALSRVGKLRMPTLAVFLAMIGGVVTFGPGGLLLGPLFVRLAIEVLQMWRDEARLDHA